MGQGLDTRRRGPDKAPRTARIVNDDGLVAIVRHMWERGRQTDVAADLGIDVKTVRRIVRTGAIDKGQYQFLAGRVAAISSLFLPDDSGAFSGEHVSRRADEAQSTTNDDSESGTHPAAAWRDRGCGSIGTGSEPFDVAV